MKRQSLDLENCLMLLSSPKQKISFEHGEFECKTCNRKFSSFQALGGHRASHKRQKVLADDGEEPKEEAKSLRLCNKPKMHQCSICGMGFSLGQALGGHMRKHRTAAIIIVNQELQGVSNSINHIGKIPVLKRSNSKRVMAFDLDLNLTPLENDLVLGLKFPPPIPLSLF